MWKKVSQEAQVADKDRQSLMQVFVNYASARNTGGSQDGSLMKWIKEAVPNVDNSLMKKLMNDISSSRDRWTACQKELIDYKREHDLLLTQFPSNVILAMFGKKPVDIKIVTSTRSEKAFETGKDDDTSVT
jgi:hypothetical protein